MNKLMHDPSILDIPVKGGIMRPALRRDETETHHVTRSLSQLFHHRRGLILSLSLIAMMGSVLHSLMFPPLFRSSVLLYIEDPIAGASSEIGGTTVQQLAGPSGQDNWSSVFHDVRSTELNTFLIDRFNLIEHYGLDTTGRVASSAAIHLISENIQVHRTDENGMKITVSDRDRTKAADLANAIPAKLMEMSNARIVTGLSKAISLYTKAMEGMSIEGRQVVNDLTAVSRDLHRNYPITLAFREEGPFAPVEMRIQELAADLSSINADLLRQIRSMEITMAHLKDIGSPNIRVIRGSQRDMFTSPGIVLMAHAAFWFLSTALLLFILMVIWEVKGPDIRSAYTTPLNELMDP
jgi:capsular polysaccharide biosynthesis protein